LREEERDQGFLADACNYLRNNPVRAELVESAEQWAFAGSLVPGFPDLDEWDSNAFWRCYAAYRKSRDPGA